MKYRVQMTGILVVLMFLVHCGKNGGGGGGAGSVGSVGGGILSISLLGTAPISKTTSPQISTITAAAMSGSVRIPNDGIEIHLQASAPLDPQTVNTDTFVLYESGNALAHHLYAVILYDQNTKVAIIPDYTAFQFQDNKLYTLEITKDVKGSAMKNLTPI